MGEQRPANVVAVLGFEPRREHVSAARATRPCCLQQASSLTQCITLKPLRHTAKRKTPAQTEVRRGPCLLSRDTTACRWASDERHSVADLGAIMHYFVNLRK